MIIEIKLFIRREVYRPIFPKLFLEKEVPNQSGRPNTRHVRVQIKLCGDNLENYTYFRENCYTKLENVVRSLSSERKYARVSLHSNLPVLLV